MKTENEKKWDNPQTLCPLNICSLKIKPLKIGSVILDNPTIMAPLAGITDLPFRIIIKETGCGLVCSEMISANGLVHQSKKTLRMLDSLTKEKPLSVQIFGSDPVIMAKAAAMAASSGADIVDLNLGCSVKKIVKTGSGVALMKDYENTRAILKAVRKAIHIPLTIKIRSGWDSSGAQAITIAEIAESQGVDAVIVHPRTARQGFRGTADWSLIADIKKRRGIPIIGNGDIVTPEKALEMMEETGCNGVMIGRAAIGNPWIFKQVHALLAGRSVTLIDPIMQRDMMIRYLKSAVQYYGEIHACRVMRSRLCWFVKGLPNVGKFRQSITQLSSERQSIEVITNYFSPFVRT